jgi:hypothetical protein
MFRDASRFLPRPQDRFTIIGPTGSGKTELARAILAHFDNVVVIDPKLEFSWGSLRDRDPQRFRRMARNLKDLHRQLEQVHRDRSGDPIVYRPQWNEVSSGAIDIIPLWALKRKDTLLFYDELEACVKSGGWEYLAPNFTAANMQGRSKFVGMGFGVKSPTQIPRVILRESQLRYIFFLELDGDQKRAEEIFGAPIDWDALLAQPYSWMFRNRTLKSGPHWLPGPL